MPVVKAAAYPLSPKERIFINDLEHRTFNWFWETANPRNGLVPDRAPLPHGAASIASVGFGLTAYGIGVKRGYITRQQAVERTLLTLRFLAALPQGDAASGTAGTHGFFYHFLDPETGLRVADWSELSSIDTVLLMGGVLFAQSYYDGSNQQEQEIRALADGLYRRVDWQWMTGGKSSWLSMGWMPPDHFLSSQWTGYNEGLMLYLLALASPTHALPADTWDRWTETHKGQQGSFYGHDMLNFAPLFGHQYSECWVDFRNLMDKASRRRGYTYFQNSRRAAYAQREYARHNPGHWKGYSADIWGLTASDGPGDAYRDVDGQHRHFLAYSARGAGRDYVLDDGTIAPTAAGGSVAFAPEIALPALQAMKAQYGSKVYNQYGFLDAFNPSFADGDSFWVDNQQLGIDQGPILLMIENLRSGLVWKVMKKNAYLQKGLHLAGFQKQ
ncbi:Tat pathway signal protein [Bombella sp. TMW2.1880]|uniref:Tat pathway signal protein n=2 Tax=Bombella favorum TaxID=2039164 RepID=A0ABR5ZK82_9PROT|nr:glucoamylase family protein [Bombella favorum]MBA5724728.1 Tat pathway signal protein [Bombella favorum]